MPAPTSDSSRHAGPRDLATASGYRHQLRIRLRDGASDRSRDRSSNRVRPRLSTERRKLANLRDFLRGAVE